MNNLYTSVCICLIIIIVVSPTGIEGKPSLYDCSLPCSSFACINTTLCQLNKYTSTCGCCHLCFKNNLEYCGGPYGIFGVCNRGLACTVRENKFLTTEDSGIGRCLPLACLKSCRRKRTYPVCGSNGYVFKNICELRKYSCVRGIHVSPIPLSQCVNNRHCKRFGRACNFIMLLSKKGNFNNIWAQAFKCSGMASCTKVYSDTTWCASNERSYSSKCQMNMHGCILNEDLRANYMGQCSTGNSESAGIGILRQYTDTQTIIPTDTPLNGEQREHQNNMNTYNSSDPYST